LQVRSLWPARYAETALESTNRELENPMTDALESLAIPTASLGYGTLVFAAVAGLCSSRQGSQIIALISDTFLWICYHLTNEWSIDTPASSSWWI